MKSEIGFSSAALQGDKDALIQVITNLLSNAIKFSDPQKPAIAIRTSEEAGQWQLVISDNGPGIDILDQELIFDKFYQVNNAPAVSNSGSGLGLAISKKIIELHQGKIRIENNPSQGASFIFTIPFNQTSI